MKIKLRATKVLPIKLSLDFRRRRTSRRYQGDPFVEKILPQHAHSWFDCMRTRSESTKDGYRQPLYLSRGRSNDEGEAEWHCSAASHRSVCTPFMCAVTYCCGAHTLTFTLVPLQLGNSLSTVEADSDFAALLYQSTNFANPLLSVDNLAIFMTRSESFC